MQASDRKARYLRFLREVIDERNLTALDEYLARDLVDHGRSNPSGDLAGARRAFSTVLEAFPDARISVDQLLADGELVVARCTLRGTNRGPLLGAAPTGRSICVTGIDIARFTGDKIAEHWEEWDWLGMLEQLGLLTPFAR